MAPKAEPVKFPWSDDHKELLNRKLQKYGGLERAKYKELYTKLKKYKIFGAHPRFSEDSLRRKLTVMKRKSAKDFEKNSSVKRKRHIVTNQGEIAYASAHDDADSDIMLNDGSMASMPMPTVTLDPNDVPVFLNRAAAMYKSRTRNAYMTLRTDHSEVPSRQLAVMTQVLQPFIDSIDTKSTHAL